jgi:hypothetical protein
MAPVYQQGRTEQRTLRRRIESASAGWLAQMAWGHRRGELSMQTRSHLNALLLLLLLGAATAADAQVRPELARRYFEEAVKLCERDAGRLWGVSLCGPMVIVDLLPDWRRQVRRTSDLGDLLASSIKRPPTTEAAVAAARYDGAALRTAEEARDRTQQARVAELRRRFVDGPVLTMPAAGSGTSDTTGSVGIPGVGTVFFRNFTLSAQWGRLAADAGVLRAADGATLSVPVTRPLEGTSLQGDGWSVTLNSGWVVRPAAPPGSFVIVREK